jgi:histidinol-phosphatase (PHP family)
MKFETKDIEKMKKENHHTHTTGSDGNLKPEELVKLAIKKKFDVLGITDHYSIPPGFRNSDNEDYEYYSKEHYGEIRKLQKKYKDKIKIEVNVEFDWIKDYANWIKKEALKRTYDLRFVSIHYLEDGDRKVPLDWKEEGFLDSVRYFGSVKKVVKWYYKNLRQAVKSGCFDVVSHLDIIKIWNKNKKFFDDGESWYKKEVLKTLDLISRKKMKLDLNSAGLRKPCKEQYPAEWIVGEAKKRNIPLLIGTDAHKVDELESGLGNIQKLI